MNDEIYIISWCQKYKEFEDTEQHGNRVTTEWSKDHWQVRETLQEAEELYNEVMQIASIWLTPSIQIDAVYAASISAVVQSTDYPTHPRLRGFINETNETSSAKPA